MTRRGRPVRLSLAIAIGVVAASGCSGDDESNADASPVTPTSEGLSTTTTISPAPAPSSPLLFDQTGPLDSGTYLVDKFGTPLYVTVPEDWSTFGDFALTSPAGWEVGYLGFWEVEDINLDACHRTERAYIGPSVRDLVDGLSGQTGMDVGEPEETELDGHEGQSLVVSPADVDPATCDEGFVTSWFEPDGDTRTYVAPQETETLQIVNIDGRRAVINVGSLEETTPEVRTQLEQMLASIRVG